MPNVTGATLLVIQGSDQGSRFAIEDDVAHIGRAANNEVRILDTEISRRHAELSCVNGEWSVADLNSSNGTFLNGKPVQRAALKNGDQIQVGRTILLFAANTDESVSSIAQRINLVPEADPTDKSRIVGRSRRSATSDLLADASGSYAWSEAGANLQLLYRITEEVVRPSASLDESLQRILDLTLEAIGADRGCMLVTDSKTDRIEPRIISHRAHVNVDERMPISTSIVRYVIQNGHGVRTSDAQHDSRFEAGQSILKSGIREAMCVPMHGRFELMGVIYIDTTSAATEALLVRSPRSRFNDRLLALLLAVGRQSALAIENHRYQQSLVSAERLAAMGQTIAILSHHIKNILQGMRGGCYLIDMGLKQGENELVRKGWKIVDRNQDRIFNLVMDMLTFSKEREPVRVATDLNELVEEILDLVSPRVEEQQVVLRCELGTVPLSMFDREGLHRAILNIIANALDALRDTEQPRLTVRSGFDAAKDQLYVEVEDNGPGLAPEELPKLFNLFESNKGARGTGLGLSVSRKILEEHGGDIHLRSAPGQGARFRLHWPRSEPEHDDRPEPSVAPTQVGL